ncbi:hypothetical protein E1B28_009578 [Marasmius oreades]|uniref:Uncharacterized protein n=1 Tax=Marasmius oreades TaxID=181124 RepID=A0A9P7RVI7_9AGAR|nr:uncharacterized protein E1B28_009578 [Marasmius oreades]KAG7090462.1 hypothetical protein E1B28_009578 [Marasmius oreades]
MGSRQSALYEQDSPQSLGPRDFSPSENDVVQVRFVLLNFLPRELVDIIIDEAEYWCRACIGERNEKLKILACPYNQHDARLCYLLTQPIPGNDNLEERRPRKVRKVVFNTKSHDQGWGGPPTEELEEYGPYHGSFTWFEAGIVRFIDESAEPVGIHTLIADPQVLENFMVGPSPRRWFVYCNRTADYNTARHATIWSLCDEDRTNDENVARGRMGKGREFLSHLEPGDRIALLGRAMFPQWTNHIVGASIDIVYSL